MGYRHHKTNNSEVETSGTPYYQALNSQQAERPVRTQSMVGAPVWTNHLAAAGISGERMASRSPDKGCWCLRPAGQGMD